MALAKRCVARGCMADPHWGFGSALAGTMRWACLAHRGLIWITETLGSPTVSTPAAAEGRAQHRPSAALPAKAPFPKAQGSLFG
ncbi:MAG: hypothetical protein KGZ65_03825 [Sphingomonadales bacterium]|nr:hypothetical protein [Sphingomonadales bacterium]